MRASYSWDDYEIIDASSGEKLERWSNHILIRPDPQIIWNTDKSLNWDLADARYERSKSGGGKWQFKNKVPDDWIIKYNDLKFIVRLTGFKHTGIFPEQAVNWDFMMDRIVKSGRNDIKVLNLFGYTGCATVACAYAGANVCHVDASAGVVNWAKENARISNIEVSKIRWIVDDCEKFVKREIRRGNKYDAIIMDPPSYGRSSPKTVWQLEEKIYDFLKLAVDLISDNPIFFILNSYTKGISTCVMSYLMNVTVNSRFKGKVLCDEIGIPVKSHNSVLPCGSTCIWTPSRKGNGK